MSLGFGLLSAQLRESESDWNRAYREAPGFLGIGAQPRLDHRYLNEDVGYGLVFMTGLARQVGVATPTMDAIIQCAAVLMNRDYAGEALRTPGSLGIADLSAEAQQLLAVLERG